MNTNNIPITWDNNQDDALLGSLFAGGLSGSSFTSTQTANDSFQWKYLKKSSVDIERDFDVPFPYRNKNLTLIQEDNCPCEIKPEEIVVFYESGKNEGYQKAEDEYLFKVKIYSSRSGTKIERAYLECGVEEDEALFFIEDNTDDISSARIYAKFGTKVQKDLLLKLDSKSDFYTSISKIPGIDKNVIQELIRNGVYHAEKSVIKIFAIGLYKFLSLVGIPGKAIGWLCEKIGTNIIEFLTIPDSVWDSHSEEYFLDKENVINSLTIDTSEIKSLRETLNNDKSYKNFIELLENSFSSVAELMLHSVEILINSYNDYVTESINSIYEKNKVAVLVADIQFQISEKIALFAGLWNGLVDFLGGIFIFIGQIAQIQYNVGKDLELFLEQFDELLSAFSNFDWSKIPKIIEEQYDEIKKYFKDSNQTDLNYDKIAYFSGFAIAFI